MTDAKKVVRLNYKAYIADLDKLYDTTLEDVAKEAGIYEEKAVYKPMSYIVGSKKLFSALDAAIAGAAVGSEVTVEIPCEEAFGAHNPKLRETHNMNEFIKANIYPQPGMTVSLGNRSGTILKVGAGRVIVDFNSPLAGHDLKYVFTITEEVTDSAAKAQAIIEADFATVDGFKFDFPEGKVVVTVPDMVKFDQHWPMARFAVVSSLRDAFGVDTVEFVEVWSAAKAAEPKASE